tara:strand:+ start:18 stop:392 length:375 start_codon:yes stop_codon:yes gene_type:complete
MDRNRDLSRTLGSISTKTDATNTKLDDVRKPVVTYLNGDAHGTKLHTGPFYAIAALVDTTIDVSECTTNIKEHDGSSGTQAIATNIAIPKGMTIYGDFASIEIDAGGQILAYSINTVTVTVASS